MKRFRIILLVMGLIALLGLAFAAEKAATKAKPDPMKAKQALAKAAKISATDALATAMKKVSGTVVNMELENENGKIQYSFEILQTPTSKVIKEVNIDATNGSVIGVDEETPAAEAKEVATETKATKAKGEENEEGESKKGESKWSSLRTKVDVAKLPAAVKATVEKEAAGAEIQSASSMPKIYSVNVKSGEESSELHITSSGKLIEKSAKKKESAEKGEKKATTEKGEKDDKD